jgi:hypothetical protein
MLTIAFADKSLELRFTGHTGMPGSPEFGRGIERKFVGTLAGLGIVGVAGRLRVAVAAVEERHGPRRLRQALVAAGKAAALRVDPGAG